jgi:hypothetical protein
MATLGANGGEMVAASKTSNINNENNISMAGKKKTENGVKPA